MPTSDGGSKERFNCAELCTRKCSPGLLNPEAQAKRNCALPHFDRRKWTGELVKAKPVWMGLPDKPAVLRCKPGTHDCGDVVETAKVTQPPEDIENEGCPGAWWRTPFIESVLRYRRPPMENGGRVANPRHDRCRDELVLEAIELMEAYENSWQGEHLHQIRLKHEKERAAHG